MSKQTINWLFLLGAALILSLTTFFVGNALVRSNKENQQTAQWITNTISVMGEGKDYVTPDEFVISVSISELAKTTKEAQIQANEKISKTNDILKKYEIAQKDIQTANVSVYPEYNRTEKSGQVLMGYRATTTMTIKVYGKDFWQKGADIVNAIADVWGVNVNNTYFDLKDKNLAMQGAREKAFTDAKAKAAQLAKAWGVTLGKPVMISDNNISYTPGPIYYAKAEAAVGMGDSAASVPGYSAGETEVTVNISVVYEIK